ncbi:fabG [Symbiodinium sp. KB8]|nr:fabG [Symbiodinium sp. KB8]
MRLRCLGSARPRAPPRLKTEVAVDIPQDLLQGTVGDFCRLLAERSGSHQPAVYVPPGFAVPPNEPLSILRQDDEVWVYPAEALSLRALADTPSPQGSKPRRRAAHPPAGYQASAVSVPKRKASAPAQGEPVAGVRRVVTPAKPAGEPAAPAKAAANSAPASDSAAERLADLEALLASQAKRIAELEAQNAALQRQLRTSRPSTSGPSGNWSAVDAATLKKGNVVTYSLDLIDAWGGGVQRTAPKVSVVTKVVHRQGITSYALRCESGGVDFVEASRLRDVQLAL